MALKAGRVGVAPSEVDPYGRILGGGGGGGNYLTSADVVDNLTSNETAKPLSAKQGKVLRDTLNGVVKIVHTPLSVTTDANGGFTLYNKTDEAGTPFTINNILSAFVTNNTTSNYYCIISTYNSAVYGIVRDSTTNTAVANTTLTIDVVSYYVVE